jgi:hypothetical protein
MKKLQKTDTVDVNKKIKCPGEGSSSLFMQKERHPYKDRSP